MTRDVAGKMKDKHETENETAAAVAAAVAAVWFELEPNPKNNEFYPEAPLGDSHCCTP